MNKTMAIPVYIYINPQMKPATHSEIDAIKTDRVA
jgi:hypothetical protein